MYMYVFVAAMTACDQFPIDMDEAIIITSRV